MSFSVWMEKPPFEETDLTVGEKIYEVGGRWVVTDQGYTPTEEQINAVLIPSAQKNRITADDLAEILKQKGVLTATDIAVEQTILDTSQQ